MALHIANEQFFDLSNIDDCVLETENVVIIGEDDSGPNGKPIRLLTQFVIFDSKHSNALVSLDLLLSHNNVYCEAAGKVGPVYPNEEDAAQDYAADEDSDLVHLEQLQNFRTTRIHQFGINYSCIDG